MIDRNPSQYVGQKVTLQGVAYDAHSGAIVMLADRTPVYIHNLEWWEDEWDRKTINVTGTLQHKKLAPDPTVNEEGEVSHGMVGTDLVLCDATWVEA